MQNKNLRQLLCGAILLLATTVGLNAKAKVNSVYKTEFNIEYCTVDGKKLTLNAFLPTNSTRPCPVMVDIHGGWWSAGEAATEMTEQFGNKGIAVFSINYRLGKDGGFPENIRDCRNAIRFIRKNAARFNIDPNRIGCMGGSAGGHLSLMVAMVPENFDDGGPTPELAGVSASVCNCFGFIAPTDFVRFWNQGPDDVVTNNGKQSFREADEAIPYDSRPRLRMLFHGITPDNTKNKALYTKMCPVGNIRKDLPPLLICDGEKDPIVPGLHGKALYNELTKIGADATYWMTPNGGHNFPSGIGFQKVLDDFLIRTLRLEEKTNCSSDNYEYIFQNPDLSFEERVNDLVSHMTLEEKVSQMRNESPAVVRLGIPAYNWWNECLHGVGRSGINVTVFPQAIGMAATFDNEALQQMASITSDEARAINRDANLNGFVGAQYRGLTFWTPNINIFRDPRWGRGQETYGEDPFLTSTMGMAMVNGLQGNDSKYLKVSACAKHFAVHSGPDADRHVFDITVDDYDLWNTYLPSFEKLVVDAKVSSVMCAYNRYAGKPCCGNDLFMTDLLRNKWNFKGYVTSDCGAIEDFYQTHKTHPDAASASADAVLHGTDLECGIAYAALTDAVKKKLISEKDIDVSVKRLFMIRFRLGMFDPPSMVPFGNLPMSVIESKANHEHALKMARESIVLLKNENNTLPLNKNIKKIAVVGPNADEKIALLANYNGFPTKIVTALEGIRSKVGATTQVIYEKGVDYDSEMKFEKTDLLNNFNTNNEKGWTTEYYTNKNLEGKAQVVKTTQEINISLDQSNVFTAGVSAKNASIRFTTEFVPSNTDNYTFDITGDDGYRFFVNENKCIDEWGDHGSITHQYTLKAEAGKKYNLKLEYYQGTGGATIQLKTGKLTSGDKNSLAQKVKDADAIIFVGGISCAFEEEGNDKKSIDLPAIQTEYMKALKATGKPVIFVMYTGSAMGIEWEANNLPAIVNAWYGGQDAGSAIADVLFGDYNPAGRLPVTFYKSSNDLPPMADYSMANRTYRYFNGEPLYPFGFGLSYSTFTYSWSDKPRDTYSEKDTISISLKVKNNGKLGGDEVVQAYIQYPTAEKMPLKELKQFKRVAIAGNSSKDVTLRIPISELKKWNPAISDRSVYKGVYHIFLGGSSDDKKLEADFKVE